MTQNETIVSLPDIRFIEIHCSHCTTKVTLDMQQPSEFSQRHENDFVPKECPGCRKQYDTAIKAVNALQEIYRELLKIKGSVTFRGASSPA